MADTIDIPVAGPVKKQWVYVAAAVAAGIIGYAYWRSRISATDTPVDPQFADYSGGLQTGGDGTTTGGLAYQPGDSTHDVNPDDLPPATNAVWTQRAVEMLASLGWDSQYVATVLGKYLARLPLTLVESAIPRTAIGLLGKPPVGEYNVIIIGGTTTPPPDPTTPAPSYWRVVVLKYTRKNPPWQSSISGIAGHYGKSASSIWNDPKNASLRAKRKEQRLVRAGDVVYVRK